MSAKQFKTKIVERKEYKAYLKKAAEFYEVMLQAKTMNKYTAVGLNAVHCAISSADAMLVFYAGIRSAGEHTSVIGLLINSVKLADTKAKSETLRRILVKKNVIEYEERDFTQKEALEILKLTDRFYFWVVASIK